jgi:CHASE3 domain sensor protein
MKLTLGKELGLGFGTILLLMVISAGMSYIKPADIREAQQNILEVRAPTVEACKDLQSQLQEAASDARQGILAGENPGRRTVAAASFAVAWESIEKDSGALQELSSRWSSQENRDRRVKIKARLHGVQQGLMIAAASGERDAVVRAGDEYTDKLTPEVEQLASVLRELTDSFDVLRRESSSTLAAANSALIWSMSLTTLAALVIGAVVAAFLSRRIGGIGDFDFGAGRCHCRGRPDARGCESDQRGRIGRSDRGCK